MSPRSTVLRLGGALVLTAALVPAGSQAVVPPKSCGKMTLKGKPYDVKADQISCATGRRQTKAYVERRVKPAGYRCRVFPVKRNRVAFYCNSGKKIFFAIRR